MAVVFISSDEVCQQVSLQLTSLQLIVYWNPSEHSWESDATSNLTNRQITFILQRTKAHFAKVHLYMHWQAKHGAKWIKPASSEATYCRNLSYLTLVFPCVSPVSESPRTGPAQLSQVSPAWIYWWRRASLAQIKSNPGCILSVVAECRMQSTSSLVYVPKSLRFVFRPHFLIYLQKL